jgi:uncharacterized repeat protein (TIGR03803 family)
MKTSCLALLLCGGVIVPAQSATLITLADFNGTNGQNPEAGLVLDANGNLLGTTVHGGGSNFGTVFEVLNTGGSYGSLTTLASFGSSPGQSPLGGLTINASGSLLATTAAGGAGYGTFFQIANSGGTYGALSTLATFSNSGEYYTAATLTADSAGNLFGVTRYGGSTGMGTVYEIPKTGSTYGTPTTLATFTGTNGKQLYGAVFVDANGNLIGTTRVGGASNDGTVFEIPKTGGSYGSIITLATFTGTNGSNQGGGLIADAAGNLFGTSASGGAHGGGTIFEVPYSGGTYGPLITLTSFDGTDGQTPYSSLLADSLGNLFGTTAGGGASNDGTVYELPLIGGAYASPITLATFSGTNGNDPLSAALIANAAGDLFGTTSVGGTSNLGTVFEVTGSGFGTQSGSDVPEPASLALLAAGAAGLAAMRRRRAR